MIIYNTDKTSDTTTHMLFFFPTNKNCSLSIETQQRNSQADAVCDFEENQLTLYPSLIGVPTMFLFTDKQYKETVM